VSTGAGGRAAGCEERGVRRGSVGGGRRREEGRARGGGGKAGRQAGRQAGWRWWMRGAAAAGAGEGAEGSGNGVLRGMVHETSKRVGVDGRGHYGNRGWVSGLRDGEMVWVMFRAPWEWISLALPPNGVSQR